MKTEDATPETDSADAEAEAKFVQEYEAKLKRAEPAAVEESDDDSASTEDDADSDESVDAGEIDPEWDAAIDAAIEAGLTQDDIEGFDTAAALKSATALLKRTKSSNDEDGDTPALETAGEPVIDWDYLDPDVKEALTQLQSEHKSQVDELRSQVDELKRELGDSAKAASDARFETYVTGLSKPKQRLFEDQANRAKLREEMAVLAEGYRSRGKEVPTEAEIFTKALNASFSTELNKIDAEAVKRSTKYRQGQMSIPPSARKSALDGDQSVEEAAKDALIERFNAAVASKG